MVWTDERIAQLRKLYSEGYTAAAIAVELGFISRNAVCGKIDRLGLNAVPGVPRKKKPSVEKGTVGSVAFGILHRIKAKQNNTRAPDVPLHLIHDADDVQPLHIGIMELTKDTCRWPYGEPGSFTYCGCEKISSGPYCYGHMQLSKPPALRRNLEGRAA